MTGNGTTKIIIPYFSWSKQGITVLHVPVVHCVLIKFVHVHVHSPKDKTEKNLRFQKKPEPSMPVHSSFILYFSTVQTINRNPIIEHFIHVAHHQQVEIIVKFT